MSMVTVVFQPYGLRGSVQRGKSIMEAADQLGVRIQSACGRSGKCGKCRVRVRAWLHDGTVAGDRPPALSPLASAEEELIAPEDVAAGYRLACSAKILGDIVVFVPERSRAEGALVRKEAREIRIPLKPAVARLPVELAPPTLAESGADLERLLGAMSTSHNLRGLAVDPRALRTLPRALRSGEWRTTAAVWMGKEIIAVEPGMATGSFGMAVDIGTTTVAAYLMDLVTGGIAAVDSMLNPQVIYGEDVMSRITFAVNDPEGANRLHASLVDCLNNLARSTSARAGIETREILDMVVVGNTAMHHMFLRLCTDYLGRAPFPPVVQGSMDVKARELGLEINESAYVHILPVEAGFVGADNVAVLIALEPYNRSEVQLIVDIGTNGELVLGNRDRLLSASCATGPAFEGAHIRFGMRAAPGAIERVRIDPATHEVQCQVVAGPSKTAGPDQNLPRGICGSGIVEAVGEMLKAGILSKNGCFDTTSNSPLLRRRGDGEPEVVLVREGDTAIGEDITISLDDVKAVQLAKAAMYAGAKSLMKRFGVARPDRVLLAGAFGSYISPQHARAIGMFPDCDLDRIQAVGNAAGDGARMALLNVDKRREAERIARQVEYVELTAEPGFTRDFAEAMYFPHLRDSFSSVRGVPVTQKSHLSSLANRHETKPSL